MEDISIIIVILLLLLFVGCFIYLILWAISSSTFGFIESVYIMAFDRPFMPHCELFYRSLKPEEEQILSHYSKYYRYLSIKKQKVYMTRMIKFIKNKEFIAKGDLKLTDEMSILAADSAVKLTFGLRNYMFDKFEQILFFKSTFYSDYSKSKNMGETNPRGAIVFSWKDLMEGDMNETDNVNVGLHEFAHAYMIDNKANEDQYFEVQCELFDKFYDNSSLMEMIRSHHFFNNYAFRNKMEFFAVAVEHFFESPEKMKVEITELYNILCKMLNQDPCAIYASNVANRRPE
jgi:Mlc titration factor MtfA (ptsG expression regulator)